MRRSLGAALLGLATLAAMAGEPPAPSPPKPKSPPPAKEDLEKKSGKKADGKSKKKKAPPRWVTLPEAGTWEAVDILPLAGALHGLPVAADGPRVEGTLVEIPAELAGRRAGLEEMRLLLGAHGIYLFPHERPAGPVLVATRDPDWTPERDVPRFVKRFRVRSSVFEAAAEEVERYIEEKNRTLAPGEAPAAAACDPRTGLIIVRASSERILAAVDEIVSRAGRSDPEAVRLYSYRPRHRKASGLVDEVLGSLKEAEAKEVSLVASHRGNLILIRAREETYRKIEMLLASLDVPD